MLWVENARQYDSVVAYAASENGKALMAAAGWQTKSETYKNQLEVAMFNHPVQHKNGVDLGRKFVVGELLAQQTESVIRIASVKNENGKLLLAADVDGGSKVPMIGSIWLLGTRGQNLLHAVLEVTDFNGEYVKLSVVQVLNADYMRHILTQAETYEFPSTLEITYRRFSAIEELRKDYSE